MDSKKQLRGWLSYAFASEVFVVVSLTLFLPICLEQFARDNGYLLPDKKQPCSPVNAQATPTGGPCAVKLGWFWVDSASFSLYVYSISVALQAITVISSAGIADRPSHRKPLLLVFAALGAFSASLFLFLPSTSPVWLLSAVLAILANVGFGASVVAMNAYLPALAAASPEVATLREELESSTEADDIDTSALPDALIAGGIDEPLLHSANRDPSSTRKRYETALSNATSRISSLGIALGYGAGIILLLIALIPVRRLHGSTFSLRLAIGLSGIWWAVFSIPAAIWLPGASASISPVDDSPVWGESLEVAGKPETLTLGAEIAGAWKRLAIMFSPTEVKKLRNTFRYLAAWFLLSDGFTTITSTAVLFGKTTLNMTASALVLIGVITPTSGILGSLVWPMLQRRFGWSNLKVLTILVVMASVIPAYGCLGFVPVFRRVKFGGLTTPVEMYGLAVYFGSVYGAFQSFARATYAELIPPGEEARWFALFSITDKSSSFLGPLVVGLIADVTGNIRYSFFFLVIMVWAAVPVLSIVNVERGRQDARNYRQSRGVGRS